ncbi:MAG: hypothetical protein HON04_04000 [Planctomicrobium sp.]|jgi:hypothetical protein|nr:hypothetical protein [Planctomicrobium sp.]
MCRQRILNVLIILSCFLSGCDARTNVEGVVVENKEDGTHVPLPGAMVELIELNNDGTPSEYQDSSLTDLDGKYYTGMTHAPIESKFSVIVTKDGYQDFSTTIHSQIDKHTINVTLHTSVQ